MICIVEITIHTDGSCIKRSGPGGYCGILKTGRKKVGTIYGGVLSTNNNRMELSAVVKSLEALCKIKNGQLIAVRVYSDSTYVIDGFHSWLVEWKRNDWLKYDGTVIKNDDIWRKAADLLEFFESVEFNWIKGHVSNKNNGNNECDRIAKQMAQMAKDKKKNFHKVDLPKEI